jgi:hypothetical protein
MTDAEVMTTAIVVMLYFSGTLNVFVSFSKKWDM